MKIEHIAIWTTDLERLRLFYMQYFGAVSNNKYVNLKKQFESYFLSFDEGCRLEIMALPTLQERMPSLDVMVGLAHFAVSVGGKTAVIDLTERLRADGHRIASEPRTTGDGYFESIVLDPDGNTVEITE